MVDPSGPLLLTVLLKGGLISGVIFNLVPSSNKLNKITNLNISTLDGKAENLRIDICSFFKNATKLKLLSEIKPPLKECIGHLECETEIQLRVPAWLKQFYFRFLLRRNCSADVIPMNPMAQCSFECEIFENNCLSNIFIWYYTSWSWLNFGKKN